MSKIKITYTKKQSAEQRDIFLCWICGTRSLQETAKLYEKWTFKKFRRYKWFKAMNALERTRFLNGIQEDFEAMLWEAWNKEHSPA